MAAGRHSTTCGRTTWRLNRWSLSTADGPPARFGHNAAWVDGVGLVIFAGQSPATFYNDLWAYDPAAERWRKLPAAATLRLRATAAAPRSGLTAGCGSATASPARAQRFADTRAYDFATHAWTDETPAGERPVERCLHGCWWTDDGRLALYAGQTTGVTPWATCGS